jgi:hypothetical protein
MVFELRARALATARVKQQQLTTWRWISKSAIVFKQEYEGRYQGCPQKVVVPVKLSLVQSLIQMRMQRTSENQTEKTRALKLKKEA